MKSLHDMLADPIYGSSMWQILSSVLLAALGFVFWTLNARLFTPAEVGIASTLLASADIIMTLSLLGFDISLMRYLPQYTAKNRLITSCFAIAGGAALLLSSLFVLQISFFSPALLFLKGWVIGMSFAAFIVFYVFYVLMGDVLVALGKASLVFVMCLIFSILKLLLPFVLISWGSYGIFSSWMIASIIAVVGITLPISYKPRLPLDMPAVKGMVRFSAANYLANFLRMSPGMILPLIITASGSPEKTAYFYIAWMLSSVLFVIPISVTKSLLSEGSRTGKDLREAVKKSLKFTFIMLIPAVLVTIAAARWLLLLFGAAYSEHATTLLQLFALSSIPLAINVIFLTVKNLRHELGAVVIINAIIFAGTIGLSALLLSHGLAMIGIAWLATQLVLSLYCLPKLMQLNHG